MRVEGIEGWSHIWISFIFHKVELSTGFKATVHPPRGENKFGVFATRSTHRPNRLGLSVVELAVSRRVQAAPCCSVSRTGVVDGPDGSANFYRVWCVRRVLRNHVP